MFISLAAITTFAKWLNIESHPKPPMKRIVKPPLNCTASLRGLNDDTIRIFCRKRILTHVS